MLSYPPSRECARFALKIATVPASWHKQPCWGRKLYTPQQLGTIKSLRKKTIPLIKLNWQDYFAGAAMAGVTCVIGEHARNNEPNLKIDKGKVTDFPLLEKALGCFRQYEGWILNVCSGWPVRHKWIWSPLTELAGVQDTAPQR